MEQSLALRYNLDSLVVLKLTIENYYVRTFRNSRNRENLKRVVVDPVSRVEDTAKSLYCWTQIKKKKSSSQTSYC